MRVGDKDALIVVDVQNDFCPGGALPVQFGDMVVPRLNRIIARFRRAVFSRDWHPNDHCSFSDSPTFLDGSWPEHCVQHTPGAEFHGDLIVPTDALVVSKGTDPEREAYSAFDGEPDLAERLREWGVERVFIGGLATDYCVLSTALDAQEAGFTTLVITDACRGVNVPEGSAEAAIARMAEAGIGFTTSDDLEA